LQTTPKRTFPRNKLFELLIKTLKERNAYHRVFPLHPHAAGVSRLRQFAWLDRNITLPQGEQQRPPPAFQHPPERILPGPFSTGRFHCRMERASGIPHARGGTTGTPAKRRYVGSPRVHLQVYLRSGITHEVVRHRVFSFTQESTRYVNYKNKGMILILPEEIEGCYDSARKSSWIITPRSKNGSVAPKPSSIGTGMISIAG